MGEKPVLLRGREMLTDDSAFRTTLEGGLASAARLKEVAKALSETGADFADVAPVSASAAERDQAGIHAQEKEEIFTVGIPVILGRFSAEQLRKVADAAERYGSGTVRFTDDRLLVFPDIQRDKVANLLEGLQSVGLRPDFPALLRGASACADGKVLAKGLIEHLQARVPLIEPFRIHLCGCREACAYAPAVQIGLKRSPLAPAEETPETFDVFICGHPASGAVPATELKVRLEQLIAGYKKGRKKGELFPDFCGRVGDEAIGRLLLLAVSSEEELETD